MKIVSLIALLSLVFCLHSCAQPVKNKNAVSKATFTAMFYNVENLYDTRNDPATDDDEFTPQGRIPWTEERFRTKLDHTAEVIKDLVKPAFPDVIGFAEIENDYVLDELVKNEIVSAKSYKIVHYESPDERGIDVALLYNSKTFTVTKSEALKVTLPGNDQTRDILYVKGKVTTGEMIHIFINHWPSRREGNEISDPKRMAAAKVLRTKLDEIQKADKNANILIMGDFNDEPSDNSIVKGIGAYKAEPVFKSSNLYNLLYARFQKGDGTLYYKDWDLFDQIIVSGSLLNKNKGLRTSASDAEIFKADYLLYYDNKAAESKPNRTMGSKYFGGYSDHLPVFVKFKL